MDFFDFHRNLKNYCQSETKQGVSDETTHNFSGVPKEHFVQVSKIQKIATKLTKTHVYSTWIFIKITANLKRKMGFWRNYSQLFGST